MTVELKPWDSGEYLQTGEDMELYLAACVEEARDDEAFIAKALANADRARFRNFLARNNSTA